MAGSSLGTIYRITSWGETHGKGVGVVVDGCPAGLSLSEEDIQVYLDRRKPGQSRFTTKRKEGDQVEILSGVFEGRTTGTPISLVVYNKDQKSKDYSEIANVYRPGHADYTFDRKYGFRDYRGGGRSSGRETIARTAAGAIAAKVLKEMGIEVYAYTRSIGPVTVDPDLFDPSIRDQNALYMPDEKAAREAEAYLDQKIKEMDSSGGVVECIISGMPVGVGEPVFDKLSSSLGKAILSIGAVKGFEIGDGFAAAQSVGSVNNDAFVMTCGSSESVNKEASEITEESEDSANKEADERKAGHVVKKTNHAGGILGGMSDGSDIIFRAAFKPTPSIARKQETVTRDGENAEIEIHGRHDPIIVPRAVVVVETMAAVTLLDLLLVNMSSRLDRVKEFYHKNE
ncbi:MAG: chorismate synthase [Eubacterium sp.]|nr:chorismate synthase [Eubacterium sp.]